MTSGEATRAETACAKDATTIDYARKADLPPGVVGALGFPLAEAGEHFQATDVVIDDGLPSQRFVSARQTRCRLELRYEQGGIAHRWERVDLDFADGKWALREAPHTPHAEP